MRDEARSVVERYARRTRTYHPLDPAVYMARQELERALILWLTSSQLPDVSEMTMLEIGCGEGTNLSQMLRLGMRPEHLKGNELLPERAAEARRRLPEGVDIACGDALDIEGEALFDVVFQSLVFSSILDYSTRKQLADVMWRLAKSGGGVLWYDFVYDNPYNKDVNGVRRRQIRELFPEAVPKCRSLTLAPPISRRVTQFSPRLYSIFNALPFLRTHCISWMPKP